MCNCFLKHLEFKKGVQKEYGGRAGNLLALPFISGVTSCWSRVEREGREETRWEE